MSDVSQGPGWWQASDMKWYPPNLVPGQSQTAPSGGPPDASNTGAPPAPSIPASFVPTSSSPDVGTAIPPTSQLPMATEAPAYGAPPAAGYGPPPGYGSAPAYGAPPAAGYGPPPGYGYGAQPGGQSPYGYGVAAGGKTNGLAIASLVLSILWIFWLGSILGVIFGFIARAQVKKSNGAQTGNGLAIAGLIVGFVGVATLLLFIVLGIIGAHNSCINGGTCNN